MKKPQLKKNILIPIIALCLIIGTVAGFLFGRNTQAEADKPYIVLVDYEYSGKVVQDFKTADAAYMAERFGMPADVAKSFVESPNDWLGYTYYIDIVNPGGKAYNFFNMVCEKNGENDIYMDITSTATYSVPGGDETQICLTVFVFDNGQSDEDIKAQFTEMGAGYRYSSAEDATDTKARFFTAPLKDTK